MKCPNCSFTNPESADICKVCGYELHPTLKSEKKSEKQELITSEDSDDIELDATLTALFGKRDAALKNAEAEQFKQESENKKIRTTMDSEEITDSKTSLRIIGLFSVILLLLVIFLTSSWSKLPWKYNSESPSSTPSESNTPTPTPTVPIVIEPTPQETINAFIAALPSFINDGNIAILSWFENPDEGINALMMLKSIGKIETLVSIDPFLVSEEDPITRVQTKTVLDCIKDDSTTALDIKWDFQLVKANDKWVIQAFSTEGVPTAFIVDTPAETPAETPTKIPTGYKETGTFSGGENTTLLDLSDARYGDNTDFERIVFDFKDSENSAPSQTVGNYTASLSSSGSVITIELKNIHSISAKSKPIDLKGSKTIKSVSYSLDEVTSTAQIVITLNQDSVFKVFFLKEPGRLIVDYIPQ